MRNFLIIFGVVVGSALAFFLYTMFFVQKPQALTVTELGDSFVGKAVVQELEKLQTLKIRKEIFATAAYKALIDNSIKIKEEAIGRPNPFLPIGSGVATIIVSDRLSTSTDSQVQDEITMPPTASVPAPATTTPKTTKSTPASRR